jgi:hypothetical protein
MGCMLARAGTLLLEPHLQPFLGLLRKISLVFYSCTKTKKCNLFCILTFNMFNKNNFCLVAG